MTNHDNERDKDPYIETTIIDQVVSNGRISKNLFNKIIPRELKKEFERGIEHERKRSRKLVKALEFIEAALINHKRLGYDRNASLDIGHDRARQALKEYRDE